MSQRFVLHCIVSILFAALGWWLYQQLNSTSYSFINSISVAGYWFGFLVFLFFSWFFYLILHRRSTNSWFIAQFIALTIALISTATLFMITYNHDKQRKTEEESILQEQQSEVLQQDDVLDNDSIE